MISGKLLHSLGLGRALGVVSLTGLVFFPSPLLAQSSGEILVSLEFPPGPNRQAPRSTVGGAVRGKTCVSGTMPLTALMPNRDNQAKTISSNPTLFIYVPDTQAKKGTLVLTDDQDQELFNEEIELSGKSGILKLNISPSKQLETGKKYNWQFSLLCGSGFSIVGTSLSGNIERVDLSAEVKAQLAKSTSAIEKAEIYASNYVWQETLGIVAEQRAKAPSDWQELLTSVGLGDFAQAPFVN